jgi:oxygen-independent coproporphyrinogen-3 oxidase
MELPFNTVYSRDLLQGAAGAVADWPTKRAWVDHAMHALGEAGYAVSSAYTMVRDPDRVTFSYRDNLWRGSDLMATGVASFGHVSGVHYQNQTEWAAYVGALDRGELPLARGLRPTPHQLLIRELILQLKTGRVAPPYFQQKFGVDILDHWDGVWRRFAEQGLAQASPHEIVLSREGLLRVDGLLPALFEPQHQGVRYT